MENGPCKQEHWASNQWVKGGQKVRITFSDSWVWRTGLSLAIRAFIWDVSLSDSHVVERKFLSLGTVVIDNSEHKILPKWKDKGEFVIIGLKRSTYTLFWTRKFCSRECPVFKEKKEMFESVDGGQQSPSKFFISNIWGARLKSYPHFILASLIFINLTKKVATDSKNLSIDVVLILFWRRMTPVFI